MVRHLIRSGALVALTLIWTGTARSAQEPTPGPGSPPVATAGLASPRAVMRTFLESFYAESGTDLERAVERLDLSEVPVEARRLRGRELAVTLKRVIDRTRLVEYEAIPDQEEWTPPRRHPGGSRTGSEELSERATRAAERLVEESLEGAVPSPVSFDRGQ